MNVNENMKIFYHIIASLCFFVVFPQAFGEDQEHPVKIGICELISNPGLYDHKLVRVTGQVSRGFEDFTLRGRSCGDYFPLWLEYGGPQPAEVTFCCADQNQENGPNGKDPLYVDGIETSLKKDRKFKRFDKITKKLDRDETVGVTLEGRVFSAGTYTSESGEVVEFGYGHFGLHSLFVIQRVLRIDK